MWGYRTNGGFSILGRVLRPREDVMKVKVVILAAVTILALAVVMAGCARVKSGACVQDSAAAEYYKDHGIIWRIFHPRVMAGRPLWQKSLYWVGPGHCLFCRTALNMTTDFDNWPSPYYDLSGKSESAKVPQK